jgi:hypothetical protein
VLKEGNRRKMSLRQQGDQQALTPRASNPKVNRIAIDEKLSEDQHGEYGGLIYPVYI